MITIYNLESYIHSTLTSSGLSGIQAIVDQFCASSGIHISLENKWAREMAKRHFSIGDFPIYNLSSGSGIETLEFYDSATIFKGSRVSGHSGNGIVFSLLNPAQQNSLVSGNLSGLIH